MSVTVNNDGALSGDTMERIEAILRERIGGEIKGLLVVLMRNDDQKDESAFNGCNCPTCTVRLARCLNDVFNGLREYADGTHPTIRH